MMFKVTLLAVASAILVAAAIDKRFTNGEVAKLGEIPYIVWLDAPAACGGVLLDSTTVLTAAHCAELRPRFVRAGSIVSLKAFFEQWKSYSSCMASSSSIV
jgi:secreted trypsin-like serine protease